MFGCNCWGRTVAAVGDPQGNGMNLMFSVRSEDLHGSAPESCHVAFYWYLLHKMSRSVFLLFGAVFCTSCDKSPLFKFLYASGALQI
jgi:hypothetical protein